MNTQEMNVTQVLDSLLTIASARELARVEECLLYLFGGRQPPATDPLQQATRLFFPGLTARAWHDPSALAWTADVEADFSAILAEATALAGNGARFLPYEDPYTLELGWRGWDTFTLYRKGKRLEPNCRLCPRTSARIWSTPHGVRQGMITKLGPGAHITPHSGGVNVVLTCHLGLVIPDGCAIRVGDETRRWTPGKLMIFDDSFVHEAWNRSDTTRVVLLWDVWHPDLTAVEIRALERLFPMFDRMMRGVLAD